MTRAAGVLAALLLLVAGCSRETHDPRAAPSPSLNPSTATTATANGGLDPSLAAQAQSLAAAAQAQASGMGQPLPPRAPGVVGGDVSWPQCPAGMGIPHKISTGAPMPADDAAYVVIGLTNGPGFHVNPCLADQVAWAKERKLLVAAYSVISWPDDATQQQYGGLREAGFAQAQFNIASMTGAGLDPPIVWLDIEHVPFYDWSTDTAANAQVVVGAAQGYLDAGFRVGVYSTPYIWESIVGDLSLRVPEWRAAGQTSQAEAVDRCGEDWSIQGGAAVLDPLPQDRRDKNITCPGTEADLGQWFARS